MPRAPNEAVIGLVEELIERERRGEGRYEVISALKGLAVELRARLSGTPNEAQRALQKAIDDCIASGHAAGHLRRVGEELLGQWPVVRLALERNNHVPHPE